MKLITKIVLLLCFTYITTDKNIKIFLQKCIGSCNKKYCNISIVCRPANRTSKFTSMDVYFNPGIKLEAPIYMEIITYKRFANQYRPLMLKIKEEVCSTLLIRKTHILLGLYENKSAALGNLFDPCPFIGHRYVMPRVTNIDFYDYIPLVPIGEWKVEFILSKNVNNLKEVVLSWSDYYEIKPTGAVQF